MKNEPNTKKISLFKRLMITGQLNRLVIYIITLVPIVILCFLAMLEVFQVIGPSSIDIGGKEVAFGYWYDYVIMAIVIGSGIFGMYEFRRIRRIRKIDDRFPDFVRDLAESRRAGMTFTKAIMYSAKGNYGILTEEIKKISMQISWGNGVENALNAFSKRVKTKLISRTISLIIEASRSGGNVADVLDAAAKDAREIKLLDSERRASMLSYVAVVYVSMFVFMVIILVLSVSLIPNMTGENQFMAGGGGNIVSSGAGISQMAVSHMYYAAAIVQSIFMGLIAGVFEEGNVLSGVKHVFFMSLITFVVFKIFMSI